MPIEVTMPKLSPTMETGVIAQWLVKVGDQVKEGDVLAEIETDKATMQMKSYDEGTIVHIDHAAGDEVALGQRVLVLAQKGEDPKAVAATMIARAINVSSSAYSVATAPSSSSKRTRKPSSAGATGRIACASPGARRSPQTSAGACCRSLLCPAAPSSSTG